MGGIKKIKFVFFDFLSFGSPQAKVFNLTSILILLRIIPTSSLSNLPIKCVFKTLILPIIFRGHCPLTGIFADCNCPACGMTRGMSRLLRGDFTAAWNFNKMVFIVFVVMVILIIINLIKTIKFYRNKKGLWPLKQIM